MFPIYGRELEKTAFWPFEAGYTRVSRRWSLQACISDFRQKARRLLSRYTLQCQPYPLVASLHPRSIHGDQSAFISKTNVSQPNGATSQQNLSNVINANVPPHMCGPQASLEGLKFKLIMKHIFLPSFPASTPFSCDRVWSSRKFEIHFLTTDSSILLHLHSPCQLTH